MLILSVQAAAGEQLAPEPHAYTPPPGATACLEHDSRVHTHKPFSTASMLAVPRTVRSVYALPSLARAVRTQAGHGDKTFNKCERVPRSASDSVDAQHCQAANQARRGAGLKVSMPKLPMLATTPREDLAGRAEQYRVVVSAAHSLRRRKSGEHTWRGALGAVSEAQLSCSQCDQSDGREG